ncbi:hypothetical protein L914_10489, partial [Phytophthora nicotianae]
PSHSIAELTRGGSGERKAMARTHKTTRIKRQMADQAREEDHARTAEAVRRARVEEAQLERKV